MKCMEDMRDELIVILAGYPSNMDELLTRNPGLKSRFPINVPFPDYSSDELVEIAKGMLGEKQLSLSGDAAAVLSRMCKAQAASGDAMSGNARFVNFIFAALLGSKCRAQASI
jgi:stage V sporulation protein K